MELRDIIKRKVVEYDTAKMRTFVFPNKRSYEEFLDIERRLPKMVAKYFTRKDMFIIYCKYKLCMSRKTIRSKTGITERSVSDTMRKARNYFSNYTLNEIDV